MIDWLGLRRRPSSETRLDRELADHVERHVADLVGRGVAPDRARRQAVLELGGLEQVKEACRDVRRTRWLDDLRQDLLYALRLIRHDPRFTAAVVATLALGIGATTTIFTVVDGVLLKPLPFPEPGRLVTMTARSVDSRDSFQYVSRPDFLDARARLGSVEVCGWVFSAGTLSQPGEPEHVDVFEMSDNLFSVLGVDPALGRSFAATEDAPGAPAVAILGYGFWQRRFAGDPTVVGTTIVLDNIPRTIVGVAPRHFELDGEGELYTPLGQDTAAYLKSRVAHPVRVLGRLKPGRSLTQAAEEVAALGGALATAFPDTNTGRSLHVQPLRPDVGQVASTLWLLFAAVLLVLATACVNVASLMLARSTARQRELAMRAALGAGRSRLVRQCLAESALLAFAGGLSGVGLAAVAVAPVVAAWPDELPRAAGVVIDWRVLTFAVVVSITSALVFGLAPALRDFGRALPGSLHAGSRTVAGSFGPMQRTLVAAEIALAILLLTSAGALGRTLLHLARLDPGVRTHDVVVARMALSPSALDTAARMRAAWRDIVERTERLPGVGAVALVDTVPLRVGHNENGYWTSAAVPPEKERPVALSTCVTPGYLDVMGLTLRDGRFFDDHDRLDAPRVIVIDDVLARSAFADSSAVGRDLWIPDMGTEPLHVVGVVNHVRYWGLAADDESSVRAQFYYPLAQVPDEWLRRWSELLSIAVRSRTPPAALVPMLRHELRGASNDQVLYDVRTLDALAAGGLARHRFLLSLFTVFAGLSLVLACVGVHGVLTHLTRRRVPEFGIRMAMGATSSDVRSLVLRQSAATIGVGTLVGCAGALAVDRLLRGIVVAMQPVDATTLLATAGVMVLAALVAADRPARFASRVDPTRTLGAN